VQNGGFETGDFTAWSLSGDPKNIGVDANTFYVHSGQFGAQFGSYNATYLSQTIPTSPGTSYVLSFWLDPDGQGSVGVAWDGQYRLWWAVLGATGWTNLQYDVTATQTNTPLQFMLQDAPAYLGLDDVRVTQYVLVSPKTATPVQMLAPQVSHGNLGFGFQTVPGQNYTIQQATNLAFPNWVTCTNFTGTGAPYLFTAPATSTQPQIFFRVKEP
jgi:hypothetical protein